MANKWTPPRGVSLSFAPDRPSPFGVKWRKDGKRFSKFFRSESDQISFAKDLAREKKKSGNISLSLDPRELEAFRKFRSLTGNANLEDIARCWNLYGFGDGGRFIEDLVPEFREEKEAKNISRDTETAYKNHLNRFSSSFGGRRMDSVSPADLFAWLRALDFAPVTRSNHRKTVRTFYSWATARGYCTTNPAKIVEDENRTQEIEILTVEEGIQFFEANKVSIAVGRLALEAFGLLRYSSAKRLKKDHINFDEKGIELPASRLKTKRRQYIDGHPENLWGWLKFAPQACWNLTERQYQEEKVRAFERAGIRHPKNCLRHSACTYHYAAFKDPPLTAALMAHTNLKTMEQFYRGAASQVDGLKWFSISH